MHLARVLSLQRQQRSLHLLARVCEGWGGNACRPGHRPGRTRRGDGRPVATARGCAGGVAEVGERQGAGQGQPAEVAAAGLAGGHASSCLGPQHRGGCDASLEQGCWSEGGEGVRGGPWPVQWGGGLGGGGVGQLQL